MRYVIWGSAGHAKVVAELIDGAGGQVVALFDSFQVAPALKEVPLYVGEAAFREWCSSQTDLSEINGVVAIGGGRGADRVKLLTMLMEAGLLIPTLIHPRAVVSPSAVIEKACQVLAGAVVAADVRLGEGCIINHNANVDHECELGRGVHVAPNATLCGCISIGEFSFIGAGAVVLPRIKIGKRAVVGAGAVVTKDVADDEIVVGCPAKKVVQ